jgi:hypothetical protein
LGNTLPGIGRGADGGAALEVGTVFQVAEGASAAGVRYYRSASMTAPRTGHLWDATGHLVASVAIPGGGVGWQDGYFDHPQQLTPGATYTVSVDALDTAVYSAAGFFRRPIVNGPVSYPNDVSPSANGVSGPAGTFPSTNAGGVFYFVDIDLLSATPGAVPVQAFSPVPGPLIYTLKLGTVFEVSVPGNVLGLRYYRTEAMTERRVGVLWDSSGNQLATVNFGDRGVFAPGWREAALSAPVPLSRGVTYVVSVDAPDQYTALQEGVFLGPSLVDGWMIYPGPPTPNGVYGADYGDFPTTTAPDGGYYFVEADFVHTPCTSDADCSGTPVTPACDTTLGTCFACTSTNLGTCTGATPVCDGPNHVCVECNDDSTCSGATPACNVDRHVCVLCTATNTSQCVGGTLQCYVPGNYCVPCLTDANCSGGTPHCLPYYQASSNGAQWYSTCAQCTPTQTEQCTGSTPDCNADSSYYGLPGECVPCLSDSECSPGLVCPCVLGATSSCGPCGLPRGAPCTTGDQCAYKVCCSVSCTTQACFDACFFNQNTCL